MRETCFRGRGRARSPRRGRCRNLRHAGPGSDAAREGTPTPPSKHRQRGGRIASRGGTAPATHSPRPRIPAAHRSFRRTCCASRCGRPCASPPGFRENSPSSSRPGSRTPAPLDSGGSSGRLANRKKAGITRSSGSATQGAARTAKGSRCAAAQFASVSVRRAQRRNRGCAASGWVPSQRADRMRDTDPRWRRELRRPGFLRPRVGRGTALARSSPRARGAIPRRTNGERAR
jgi:hypothetical protein